MAQRELDPDDIRRRVDRLKQGSAYRIAFEDDDFIKLDALRPVRLELELVKPEIELRRLNIRSTIVVFGSSRTIAPGEARRRLDELVERQAAAPDDEQLAADIALVRRQLERSKYYEEAQKFARIVSRDFVKDDNRDYVVVTGGGPGIMEAANRGAHDAGVLSAGFNITIPGEQDPNPYTSPELCFQFHYFAIRKMHFLLRACALVTFPGGYGTMDELFEALTLIQTRKMARMPVVLVGKEFWRRAVNFEFLVEEGTISARDVELFSVVDTAEEAVKTIYDFYGGGVPSVG